MSATMWNGTVVATANGDIMMVDGATGKTQEHQNSLRSVRTLAVCGCSRFGLLACAGEDGRVVIFDSELNAKGSFACARAVQCLSWGDTEDKPLLVTGAGKEIRLWRGDPHHAIKIPVESKVMCVAFGKRTYVIGCEDGHVLIFNADYRDPIAQIAMTGVPGCATRVGDEVFAVGDSDCNVVVFDAQGNVISRGHTRFEPITACVADRLILFGGIAGRVDVMSRKMVRVGGFECDSSVIWNLECVNGTVVVAKKDGLELRALEFDVTGGCGEGFGVYRSGLSSVTLKSCGCGCEIEKDMKGVVVKVGCYGERVLVVLEKGIKVFRVRPKTLKWKKLFQIVRDGNEELRAEITSGRVFVLDGNVLTIYSDGGEVLKSYEVPHVVSMIPQSWNRVIVSLECDKMCDVFTLSEKEKIPIMRTKKKILKTVTSGYIFYLEESGRFVAFDAYQQELVWERQGVRSFACSDRIEKLVAVSTGTEVEITYNQYKWTLFSAGDIFGFHKTKVMLLKGTTCEILDISLPIDEMIKNKDWNSLEEMHMIGLTAEQCQQIATAALQHNEIELGHSFCFGLELEEASKDEEEFERAIKTRDWSTVLELATRNNWHCRLANINTDHMPHPIVKRVVDALLKVNMTDSAVSILKHHGDTDSLARVLIDSGNWLDAISLGKSDEPAADIVFPQLVPRLFADGYLFEALVSISRIPSQATQSTIINSMFSNSISSADYRTAALWSLARGVSTDPYWFAHDTAVGYLAVGRLESLLLLPLSADDAYIVFSLAFYVIACALSGEMPGLPLADIYLQLLIASSLLGATHWAKFALGELAKFHLDSPMKELIKYNASSLQNPIGTPPSFTCPTCGKNFYRSVHVPRLCCGHCHSRILFSGISCRPISARPSLSQSPVTLIQASRFSQPRFWDPQTLIDCHFCEACGLATDSADFQSAVAMKRECPLCGFTSSELVDVL